MKVWNAELLWKVVPKIFVIIFRPDSTTTLSSVETWPNARVGSTDPEFGPVQKSKNWCTKLVYKIGVQIDVQNWCTKLVYKFVYKISIQNWWTTFGQNC